MVWIPKQFYSDYMRCWISMRVNLMELLEFVFWVHYCWILYPLSSAYLMLYPTILLSSSTLPLYKDYDLSHYLNKSYFTQSILFLNILPLSVNSWTSSDTYCNFYESWSNFPKKVVLVFLRMPVLAIVSFARSIYLVWLNAMVEFFWTPRADILDLMVFNPSSYFC